MSQTYCAHQKLNNDKLFLSKNECKTVFSHYVINSVESYNYIMKLIFR